MSQPKTATKSVEELLDEPFTETSDALAKVGNGAIRYGSYQTSVVTEEDEFSELMNRNVMVGTKGAERINGRITRLTEYMVTLTINTGAKIRIARSEIAMIYELPESPPEW